MARQRRPASASGGRRQARGSSESRPGGTGGTVLALLLLAFAGAGGYLLFRHTAQPEHRSPVSAGLPAVAPASDGLRQRARPVAPQQHPQPTPETPTNSSGGPAAIPEPPFGEGEDVFETGAKVYVAHCAGCHGRPGAPAAASPRALQLWDPHAPAVAHMVARPPGVLYLQIADGVPPDKKAPGMPGYRHVLSETQMWDLALLLRNARQELPDPVLHLLMGGTRH